MSLYTTDAVKQTAERLGFRQLKTDVADALARDVQYRIHEIVQEAIKFMRHSRRSVLDTADINRALRVKNVEPIYGYAQRSDQARPFRRVQLSGGSAAPHFIYFPDDEELDIDELLKAPLPPAPCEVEYTAHWLAVEGVQPAIPQNPQPTEAQKDLLAKRIRLEPATLTELEEATERANATAASTTAPTATEEGDTAVKMEGVEMQNAPDEERDKATGDAGEATAATTTAAAAVKREPATTTAPPPPPTELKPAVKHALSREMRMYYERVMTAIFPDDDAPLEHADVGTRATDTVDRLRLRDAALTSLSEDPGLHQLLPYIIQSVLDKITKHLRQLDVLTACLSTLNALLSNDHLYVEPYLHQMMPGIMTCMVTKRLGASPLEPHWQLRDAATQLCARICLRYGQQYHTLQPRVARTLLRAFLDPAKPLTTQYGAIKGLAALGHQVSCHLLLPNALQYGLLLEPALVDERNERRQEAEMCRTAMLDVLIDIAQTSAEEPPVQNTTMQLDASSDASTHAEQVSQQLRERLGDLFANGVTERLPAGQEGVRLWSALLESIPSTTTDEH